MKRRIFKTFLILMAAGGWAGYAAPENFAVGGRDENHGRHQNMRIEARPGQGLQSTETVLKPAQGERIAISNRSGRVIITGWDRDTIETTAARESGGEVVQVKAVSDPARRGLWRIAPEPETQSVKREPDRFERVITPGFGGQPRGAKINLTVKVPRGVEIESISVEAGTVEVSGVDGALNIRNENGDVRVENVGKSVNVAVTRGSITVNNAGGDVHLFALIGALSASCIGGRVEASNTSGPITLSNIGGDVEAETTGGSIDLTSAVRANSHYRLKTMDGELRVAVPADAPGFSANLWSYRGEVRSDFPLTQEQEKSQTVHRLSGQYGNGQAQIRLDSFGGNISLNKLEPSAFAACGRF